MRRLATVWMLVAAAIAALPHQGWAAVTVRVAPEAVVSADEISLGDLAAVDGDETLASRLRQLRLGPAPMPGATQRIDPEYLRLRLHEPQLEPDSVQLIVPDQIIVTRAFQLLSGAAIIDAASRYIQERLDGAESSADPPAVVVLSRPGDLRVPVGTVELVTQSQVEPTAQSAQAATVTIKVDGRSYQTIPLSFRVGRYRNVVVAARALETRTPLGPGDWRIERRVSTEIPSAALTTPPESADLEAALPIKAGEVLTPTLVRPRVVVKRGEAVTVVLEGPGFRITTQGVAVTDGRRGDSLRVLNQTSKRETLGKVDQSGVVRVPFKTPGGDQ